MESLPRNRADIDRDDKVAAIVDAAAAQLADGGLAALSVAAIGRELGLAHNAVRWYFPTRDHLLVAAARRLLERVMAEKPPAARGVKEQVVWFVDRLHEYAALRAAVYERARSSPVVAEFVDEFQELLRGLAAIWLTGDRSRRSVTVDAFLASLEGALLIGDRGRRAAVVRRAFTAFTTPRP